MTYRQRYAPPPLNQDGLLSALLDAYPSHRSTPDLLKLLVFEYLKLWRMKLGYPEKRIVSTGCILAVQRVHQYNREAYLNDCIQYFKRYIDWHELAWKGHTDVRGTIDTLGAYGELFHESPSMPWAEILTAHDLKKEWFRLVVS